MSLLFWFKGGVDVILKDVMLRDVLFLSVLDRNVFFYDSRLCFVSDVA